MNYHPRFLKCQEYMREENLAATVAVSPENTLYFTKCYLMTQTDIRDRLALAVMPVDSDPVMIACKIESASVEAETWIEDKRYYVEFQRSPIDLLVEVLKEKGLAGKRIGIESDYLMGHYYAELLAAMPDTEFVLCTRVFEKVRMIKDAEEIEILGAGARQTVKAFEMACMLTKPGESEKMLGKRAINFLFEQGADDLAFICLSSGARSTQAHAQPSDLPLESGENVRIDFGGRYNHYYSDIARSALIGKRNADYEDTFARLREAYVNTYPMLRPGVAACELHQTAGVNYAKAGLEFKMTLVGHGLGLGIHELPILAQREKQILLPGMVLCYEMSCTRFDRRAHHEELVLVTENGPKLLSGSELDPKLFHIE